MDTRSPSPVETPAPAVPVAFLGRTSTLVLQDPVASLRRQLREVRAKLPAGWHIAAYYWDIESGGLDIEARGHGGGHEDLDVGIPRDGGLAALLTEAASPAPRFAVVMCEDIERSGRDTFNALKLERELSDAGIPLFATDEPIDVAGANATTVLIRRMKQGVAEWFRLQIKEKAWKGMREHTLAGWNNGTPPYGYTSLKVPHPAPAKAAQGRTKSRLILDEDRAQVVAQVFDWRTSQRAGIITIANRLNADHHAFPPPQGDTWRPLMIYTMLANPKYTGHMVWNRRRAATPRRPSQANPPAEWIWSPAPTHPAIIDRAQWDAAQKITLFRASTAADPGEAAHPLARSAYEFRSLIRHRDCKRRMQGASRPAGVYYICPLNSPSVRHAAACPDHPTTVYVREDYLRDAVAGFLTRRVLGPERVTLLHAQQPDSAQGAAAARKEERKLNATLRRIETAQANLIRDLEQNDLPALRARIRDRYAELETERATGNAALQALAVPPADPAADTALLDALPLLTGRFDDLPPRLRANIYHALDLQIIYGKDTNQAAIRATITDQTLTALVDLITSSEPPTRANFLCVPIH